MDRFRIEQIPEFGARTGGNASKRDCMPAEVRIDISGLTRMESQAILRHPGCSTPRWSLGVGSHLNESRKTRHTVVCCILFVSDASSSRSRTTHHRQDPSGGDWCLSRAIVTPSDDLPSSPIPALKDHRRSPRKPWRRSCFAVLNGMAPGPAARSMVRGWKSRVSGRRRRLVAGWLSSIGPRAMSLFGIDQGRREGPQSW